MSWLIFGILASISYWFYNFFTKLAWEKVDSILALLVFSAATFLFAVVVYLFSIDKVNFVVSKNRIRPILAWVLWGSAEIFYLKMFAKWAPLAIWNPLVVWWTVVLATILGIIILRENITLPKIAGILLCLAGIALLAKG